MKHVLVALTLLSLAATAAFGQATDSTAAAPGAAATTSAPSGAVARAVFCSGIAEREPLDALTTIPAATEKVFCFTEIIGMEGKTIRHRWVKDGATMAEVSINVGAARWRCYSTKTIAGMAGAWTVEVLDDAGNKIGEAGLTVSAE